MEQSESWELSKENILPLPQGRKIESLQNALGLHRCTTDEQCNLLDKQKIEYENAIRSYTGEDPLEPWMAYIEWTEQHFPKRGPEGCFAPLLQKCISEFKNNVIHKNDERFINICLKLANMTDKPLEVYSFMYAEKMGRTVASFYVTWALALEAANSIKKADSVFLLGLQNNANPRSLLDQRHAEFLARTMRRVEGDEDNAACGPEAGDQRLVLGLLRPHGKNKIVGSARTGSASCGYSKGIDVPVQKLSAQLPEIVINCNENEPQFYSPTSVAPSTSSLVLANSESKKENEIKPSKWTSAKVHQKLPHPLSQLTFEVHKDEHKMLPPSTPKVNQVLHNAVLSAKKEEKTDFLQAFRQTSTVPCPSGKLKQVLMCRLDRLYRGTQEFQIEMVRCEIYKKRKQECEKDLLLLEQAKMIKQMEEKVKSMEQKQKEQLQSMEQKQKKQLMSMEQMHEEHMKQKQCLDMVLKLLLSTGQAPNSNMVSSILNKMGYEATEQDILDVTARYNESVIDPAMQPSAVQKVPMTVQTDTSHSAEKQDSVAGQIPIKTPNRREVSMGEENLVQCGTVATPTIHTKEAMKIAMDIFNLPKTTSNANPSVKENTPAEQTEESAEVRADHAPCSLPFSVFVDPAEETSSSSCMLQQDAENIPPEGYFQVRNERQLAGILAPSVGIPVLAIEDQEDLKGDGDEDVESQTRFITQQSLESFTMPANTMFFTENARIMSTPVAAGDQGSIARPKSCETGTNIAVAPSKDSSCSSVSDMPDDPCTKAEKIGKHAASGFNNCSHLSMHGEIKYSELSTITETNENKSSSSSSSGASSAATFSSRMTSFRSKSQGNAFSDLEKCGKSVEACGQNGVACHLTSIAEGVNPFDDELKLSLLGKLDASLLKCNSVVVVNGCIGNVSGQKCMLLNNDEYIVDRKVGSGAYATIFKVARVANEENRKSLTGLAENLIFKVQKPACLWEFYIANELQHRLRNKEFHVNALPSFMKISTIYLYDNGSVLITEFHKGTLLDIVNAYVLNGRTMPQQLALYFTIEILHIVEQMHECRIIHADLKPDNLLFVSLPTIDFTTKAGPKMFASGTGSLKLIDYGRSIDMSLFPPGTTFTTVVDTRCFECIEMKEKRPWTYQTDLFGVAACAHIMLFGTYMIPKKTNGGRWRISSAIKRYWNTVVWSTFFDELLNVPSCERLPNIVKLRTMLEECLFSMKDLSRQFSPNVIEMSQLHQGIWS